jgi:hypothetical protein
MDSLGQSSCSNASCVRPLTLMDAMAMNSDNCSVHGWHYHAASNSPSIGCAHFASGDHLQLRGQSLRDIFEEAIQLTDRLPVDIPTREDELKDELPSFQ